MWNPWRTLHRLEREMDRAFGSARSPRAAAFPPVNIYTSADGATVTAELPGVKPEDIDLSVVGQSLILRGERKPDDAGDSQTWHRNERAFGQFSRSIDLPFRVDGESVKASCRDGVLEVRLERSEADKPRKITVQA
jgi:HSP20 family protein